MEKKKNEYGSLVEMIEVRNEMLKNLFRDNGFDVKLVGSNDQPIIVIKSDTKTFAIAGFVNNFDYNFCDKPFGGEITRTVNIKEYYDITFDEISELIESSEVRNVYSITDWSNGLDFSHIKTEDNGKLTFHFNEENPRYFLSKGKLYNTIEIMEKNGYSPIINNLTEKNN